MLSWLPAVFGLCLWLKFARGWNHGQHKPLIIALINQVIWGQCEHVPYPALGTQFQTQAAFSAQTKTTVCAFMCKSRLSHVQRCPCMSVYLWHGVASDSLLGFALAACDIRGMCGLSAVSLPASDFCSPTGREHCAPLCLPEINQCSDRFQTLKFFLE